MPAVPCPVLILGLTFKENVHGLRKRKVADLASELVRLGHVITIHDPHADAQDAAHENVIKLVRPRPPGATPWCSSRLPTASM
jgi:UDP-N-acetyl-D-mannosaminuronate dehydrogenase